MENTAPTICPITGLVYFMTLEDENGKFVHTYGGPFDSYTIPEKDDDGEYMRKRFCHDRGEWMGWETFKQ